MTVFYDAGVLVAADRGDRRTMAEHRVRLEMGLRPYVPSPVVAQASRGPRQANLRRLLRGCEIVAFAPDEAHAIGELLANAKTADVVDGHLVWRAAQGADPVIVTGDAPELTALANALGQAVAIVEI